MKCKKIENIGKTNTIGGSIWEPKTVSLNNFPPVLNLAKAYAIVVAIGKLRNVAPKATIILLKK